MAHNDYVFHRGLVHPHTVPTPGRLRKLDQLASESVNAREGGFWSPTSPINLGGAGVTLSGATCELAGGVATGRGSNGIILGPGILPTLDPPAIRSVTIPIENHFRQANLDQAAAFVPVSEPAVGIQHVSPLAGSFFLLKMLIPRLALHRGATLAKATLRFRYTRPPSADDLEDGRSVFARLVRLDPSGERVYTPTNLVDLYIIPQYVAGATYAAGDVVLRTGTGGGRQYRCLVPGISAGSSASWTTVLGATQTAGSAVFVCEPQPWTELASRHYVVAPYAAGDLRLTADLHFANGSPVDLEIIPNNLQVIDTTLFSYALWVFSTSTGRPIFHSLRLDFEGISDLRPQ